MRRKIALTINKKSFTVEVEDKEILLDVLRNKFNLIGAKEGCGDGECGVCTVIMNGKAVNSCLVLAVEADCAEIDTIEGQAINGKLNVVQQAFVDEGAIQCGFCTPGMVMSTIALLNRNPNPSEEDIKDALVGNLCRCTGYYKILKAVKSAVNKMKLDSFYDKESKSQPK